MPKLIDYSGRFDCLREAAFTIVLREGTTGLTIPAVATELLTSVSTIRRSLASANSLPRLAYQWIDIRDRFRVDRRAPGEIPGTDTWSACLNALLRELPFDHSRTQDARVRAAVLSHDRFREWAVEASAARADRLRTLCDATHQDLALSATDLRYESQRLEALIEGTTANACAGRLVPEECVSVVRRHVLDLRAACQPDRRPDAA